MGWAQPEIRQDLILFMGPVGLKFGTRIQGSGSMETRIIIVVHILMSMLIFSSDCSATSVLFCAFGNLCEKKLMNQRAVDWTESISMLPCSFNHLI